MKEYSIGSRVRIKDYEDIPEAYKTRGLGRMCGEFGTIEDIFYSEAYKCNLYVIQFDNYTTSTKLWKAEQFELVDDNVIYTYEFEFLDNVVVARLFEVRDGIKTAELAKGHGHIIHDGVEGIAQASSHALKRIYRKVAGMEE